MSAGGEYVNYDGLAPYYDGTRVIPAARIAEIVTLCGRTARIKRGHLFLDAGVGTGRFGAPLAAAYPGQVVGVDVSSEMLARAREKAGSGLMIVQGDLQRLPFPDKTFQAVLIVHILHLVERWQTVLVELRRVIAPGGVLLLGAEQGGKSVLVDFYFRQARILGASTDNLGVPGTTQPLAFLRRPTPTGVTPRVSLVSGQHIIWRRNVSISETLAALEARVYSQMRHVDDAVHRRLIDAVRIYALKTLGSMNAVENLDTRFVLYAVWT